MKLPDRVRVFDSQGNDYRRAFQAFLDHTNQKEEAHAWLERFIASLPRRRVFLDVGAGNGKSTAWLVPLFERTIALEPNPALRADLAARCPGSEILSETIDRALPSSKADFVLCGHVFYYIPGDRWLPSLERLASWCESGGAVVVALQHHASDCMRMVQDLLQHRFDLERLGQQFGAKHGANFRVTLQVVPARIVTKDLATAAEIAEFVLNTVAMETPPLRERLEEYLRERFAQRDGGYRISCDQAFLTIHPLS